MSDTYNIEESWDKVKEMYRDTLSNGRLLQIECMRSSLLNGFWGAAIGGIAYYFYSSKIKTSTHVAMLSYWVVASVCWYRCKKEKYELRKQFAGFTRALVKPLPEDEYVLPSGFKQNENENDHSSNKT